VIDKPVIIGGGIGTGRQIAAALAMGAEGVVLGTRMLVAEELWIHRGYKERVVAADGKRRDQDGDPGPSSRVSQCVRRSRDGTRPARHHRLRAVPSARQRCPEGTLDFGHSAVFADAIEPVERIFDRLLDDAAAATHRLQDVLVTRASANAQRQ